MASINGTLVPLAPPPGYVVDFDNPERILTPTAYWMYGAGMVLAFLFLLQRLHTKIFLMKTFNLDDYCLVGSWAFSLATQIPEVYEWSQGNLGIHMWELPVPRFERFLFLIYLAPILYAPCQILAKVSLLIFYHRLSPVRGFKLAVNFTIFVVVFYNTAIMFALIFSCWPVQKNFDLSIPKEVGACNVNLPQVYIATCIMGIITDLMVLMLPLPTVLRLQVSRAQKIGLVFIFSIGSATFVTSIVRLALLVKTSGEADLTWAIAEATMWIGIEANLFIMCGSLPTLRKFAKHVGPVIFGESFASMFSSRRGGRSGASKGNTGNSYPLKISTGGNSRLSTTGKNGFSRLDETRDAKLSSSERYGVETSVHTDMDNGVPSASSPTDLGLAVSTDAGRGHAHSAPGSIVQTRETIIQYERR
ncbi:hypothetical protein MCOR27_007097 [Pyricularia oryzae]|uniref:Rhodopsin domain-containing protein n=1 Tax=Pyricularia grisea TaxID=148305 RepID=A0ABQ8NA35_PYRGI|nr:hypothetical protein MCOR01_002733 [Pyricularia oryzae]KAI6293750.1 hypothetical protein MCOR33_008906 [Pyricularia grisea]KAI6258786.1 hypothetical protein MCOR19_004806 [Pyricularia oryzae]KAI6275142.1 hypothetical protein MCOR27_007097 [Pyricularia oryzae]KAI6284760.1 hypothetical protein MCOR26_001882 [Pyricularia oryzae]